ncbi:1652_t:CDS:2, partial [Ambispora gerdemannii]
QQARLSQAILAQGQQAQAALQHQQQATQNVTATLQQQQH